MAKKGPNLWNRLKRAFSLKGPTSFEQFFNLTDDDVIIVTEETARALSAVYTCLEVRALDFAQLPKGIFIKDGLATNRLVNHPVNILISRRPNGYQSAYDFWSAVRKDADTYGNSYSLIERDNRTNPIALHRVKPYDLKEIKVESGELVYDFRQHGIIPGSEVFHIKTGSEDGIKGISPLRRNADTIGLAKKQENFAKTLTGSRPPAILSVSGTLNPEQMREVRKQFEDQKASGKTPVLPEGMQYLPTMLSPQDIEIVTAMELTARQIYGIYRIPPIMAGDYTNTPYGNAEQQDLQYVKYGLMPMIVQVEQEINNKLLTRARDAAAFPKINVNGLLRGDINTRTNFYVQMLNHGVLTPNQVLELEDMDGYQDGDKRYVNAAMMPVDKVDEFWDARNGDEENGAPVSNSLRNKVYEYVMEGKNGNGEH